MQLITSCKSSNILTVAPLHSTYIKHAPSPGVTTSDTSRFTSLLAQLPGNVAVQKIFLGKELALLILFNGRRLSLTIILGSMLLFRLHFTHSSQAARIRCVARLTLGIKLSWAEITIRLGFVHKRGDPLYQNLSVVPYAQLNRFICNEECS